MSNTVPTTKALAAELKRLRRQVRDLESDLDASGAIATHSAFEIKELRLGVGLPKPEKQHWAELQAIHQGHPPAAPTAAGMSLRDLILDVGEAVAALTRRVSALERLTGTATARPARTPHQHAAAAQARRRDMHLVRADGGDR